jgi:hypothetical protein
MGVRLTLLSMLLYSLNGGLCAHSAMGYGFPLKSLSLAQSGTGFRQTKNTRHRNRTISAEYNPAGLENWAGIIAWHVEPVELG